MGPGPARHAVRNNGRVPPSAPRRDVVVLGSTGSVGTQALEVVADNRDKFRVVGIAAGGGNPELLVRQALDLGVAIVAVARPTAVQDVQLALYSEAQRRGYSRGEYRLPKILAGPQAVAELAEWPCDVVLNAVDGAAGLRPTLAALRAGRILALANKESLIVGGSLVRDLAAPGQIVPVDSEHSALAQCLRGGDGHEVRKLVVTASGGPFRGRRREELTDVTPEQALAHPTWQMGPVITVNSATLVNKALEVVEAHLLFDIPFDRIEVVVHPQSMVHSMVEFVDGSTLAQCSPPDMRLPIALALGWPHRVADAARPVDWTTAHTWEFLPLDDEAFPAIRLAREVGELGGTYPAVYNAANEECVRAFLDHRLPFLGIVDTVQRVVAAHDESERARSDQGGAGELTVEAVLAADGWAREQARTIAGIRSDSRSDSSAVRGDRGSR
ncbi:MAG: 1-deoxy-D-xylulose-5-phosphate reductoisomerase [Streptosporangiales bacterium]|nr:1-deoxy-D-xylulose-5-phosphate reductoisomerase [Streptosporangiales bacterium]